MTSAGHRWDARDYADNSSAQTEWATGLIGKLSLQGHEDLLDIGCGDGRVSATLADAVPSGRVVGIDLSAEMVAAARGRLSSGSYPNLRFHQMDAARIDLPDAFDVAFSNAALHWVEDHRAVLAGVAGCLRPGGRLLFQMGGEGNAAAVLRSAWVAISEPRWARLFVGFSQPYHFYAPADYRRWLAEAGFRTVRAELVPKDMSHDSVEGLIGWLRTTWFPFTDRLPCEWREPFLSRLATDYLAEHPPDAEGRTHVAMVRLEVEAVLG